MAERYLLEYHIVLDSAAPDAWRLGVWFEPILPDGTSVLQAAVESLVTLVHYRLRSLKDEVPTLL